MESVLQVEREGAVSWMILNRPKAANAVDDHLLRALSNALMAAENEPEVRAVVIAGNGSSFCAGADIKGAGSEAEYIRTHGHPRGVEGWRSRVKEEVDVAFVKRLRDEKRRELRGNVGRQLDQRYD